MYLPKSRLYSFLPDENVHPEQNINIQQSNMDQESQLSPYKQKYQYQYKFPQSNVTSQLTQHNESSKVQSRHSPYKNRQINYSRSISTSFNPAPASHCQLQSHILQLQKNINNQKYQIESLTQQLSYYLQICKKNKQEINQLTNNKQLIINQYEQQIQLLLQQRQNISEIYRNVNLQFQENIIQAESNINSRRQNNVKLAVRADQLLNLKETRLKQIKNIDNNIEQMQTIIKNQQERIDQLRNIQRKFNIAVKDLDRIKNLSN